LRSRFFDEAALILQPGDEVLALGLQLRERHVAFGDGGPRLITRPLSLRQAGAQGLDCLVTPPDRRLKVGEPDGRLRPGRLHGLSGPACADQPHHARAERATYQESDES